MKKIFIILLLISQNTFSSELIHYPIDEQTSVEIKYTDGDYELVYSPKMSATLGIKENFGVSDEMCAHNSELVEKANDKPEELIRLRKKIRGLSAYIIKGRVLPIFPKSQKLIEFIRQHAISKGKNFNMRNYRSYTDLIKFKPILTLKEGSIYRKLGVENHVDQLKEQITTRVNDDGQFKAFTNAADLICDLRNGNASLELIVEISNLESVSNKLLSPSDIKSISSAVEYSYSKVTDWKDWFDFDSDNKNIILSSVLTSIEFNRLFNKDILSLGTSNAMILISSLINENGKPYALNSAESIEVSSKIKGSSNSSSQSKSYVKFDKIETFKQEQ
jgi:hypothetical protein